jgi:hypothetical protein
MMEITIQVWHILALLSVGSFLYFNHITDKDDHYFGGIFELFLFVVLNLVMWLIYFIIY